MTGRYHPHVAILPTHRPSNVEIRIGAIAFLAAFLVAAYLVRPFRVATVGYDTAASVVYFQRLAAGLRLEAFLGTTPKPFFTVVYGIVQTVTGDWRVISWLGIAAFAAGIGLTAVLVARFGGLAAAAYVTIGLIGSVRLLDDVEAAYAISWSLAGWALVGILLTGSRPRWFAAGLCLMVVGLLRYESLLIVGVAAAALTGASLRARLGRGTAPPARAWFLLLGLLAIPIEALHDLVLTGDPWYSLLVPVLGSRGAPLIGLGGAVSFIYHRYLGMAALVALGVLGAAVLARRRAWVPLAGALALGPGIVVFVLYLGWRRIWISDRYLAPADLTLIVLAAVGVAALRVPELDRLAERLSARARTAALVCLAGIIAVASAGRFGPLDTASRTMMKDTLISHLNEAQALPVLAAAIRSVPGIHDRPPVIDPTAGMGARAVLRVPAQFVPQLVAELDLPLDRIAGLGPAQPPTTDGTYPKVGEILYHDRVRDGLGDAFPFLEVTTPTTVGAIRLIPLGADPRLGWWVIRVATP